MNPLLIFLQLVVVLLAVVIHETSHGYVAWLLGDPTAKLSGRLTLNPIYHIDPIGTVILPLFLALMHMPLFGWAKPVPVNPSHFRDWRKGMMLVAIAGPGSNIALGTLSGLLLFLMKKISPAANFFAMRFLTQGGNLPLLSLISLLLIYSFLINFFLALFNLIPIPPLDGSRVLAWILPRRWLPEYYRIERYGILILFVFIYLDSYIGILNALASPIYYALTKIAF